MEEDKDEDNEGMRMVLKTWQDIDDKEPKEVWTKQIVWLQALLILLPRPLDSISFDIANSTHFLLEPLFFNLVLHTAVSEDEQGRVEFVNLTTSLLLCADKGEKMAQAGL